MNEFSTILKAHQFLKDAGTDGIPVDIERLATTANAKIKIVQNLKDDESGQTFPLGGQHIITVNGHHREERQRFTVLHEIAHIVLELPSQHHGNTLTTRDLVQYRHRPTEEILCDVFAAECLLPHKYFSKDVRELDISINSVKKLAEKYKASMTSAGSRFAINANEPCAFVLSENGRIRYVSRSKHLRELNGWIDFNVPVPKGSVAHHLIRNSTKTEDYDEIETDTWFNNSVKNYPFVVEESILLREWDQCLSLIWFDEDVRRAGVSSSYDVDDDEPLLKELDGVLPWPSKSRRK